jgi:hypothetical protein
MRRVDDHSVLKLVGNYCHDRFCTPCARGRASVIRENLTRLIGHQRIRFITLTLKAEPGSLGERIDRLLECFRRLRGMPVWKRHVHAGAYFLECKWSAEYRSWHAHVHVVVTGSYVPQASLSVAWEVCTGDSRIVDIRSPSHADTLADYVTKYVTKALDGETSRDADRLDELIVGLKGRRLATTIGEWRGSSLTEAITDGEWEHFRDFGELLDDYVRGKPYAVDAVSRLGIECIDWLTSFRPRPPPERTLRVQPTTRQLLLWDARGNLYPALPLPVSPRVPGD